MIDIEHPDITSAMLTGYPRGHKEDDVDICDVCGDPIDYDDVYEDCGDILCRKCLLARYKRDVEY